MTQGTAFERRRKTYCLLIRHQHFDIAFIDATRSPRLYIHRSHSNRLLVLTYGSTESLLFAIVLGAGFAGAVKLPLRTHSSPHQSSGRAAGMLNAYSNAHVVQGNERLTH